MFKKFAALAAAAALSLGVMTGCGASGTTADSTGYSAENPLVLTLAHGLSETHTVHIAMTQFADEVAEKTDGRIQVKIFPNGQLGSENENLEQLQAGVIAMTKVSAPGLATYNDAFNTFGLPYIFNDTDDFYHVMDSQEMQDFFLSTGDDGFVTLTYYTSGARSFYTKDRAIRTPADLKGLKIRVQDMKSQTDMMSYLGGIPVAMSYGDVYTSLQTGIIDGTENNETALTTGKHGEVCKVYSVDQHAMIPDVLIMSEKVWETISPEDQEIILEAAHDSTDAHKVMWDSAVEEAVKEAQETMGVEFVYDVDKEAFREATQPMIEAYEEQYPGVKTLLDTIDAARGEEEAMKNTFAAIKFWMDKILSIACAVLLTFMTVLVLIQVFSRYILNSPVAFTEELVRYSLIWTGFIGAAYAFSTREHMSLTLIRDKFTGKAHTALLVVIDGLILLMAIFVFTIGGFKLAVSASREFSALLGIPRSLVYSIAPISGVFIVLAQIINIYEDVTGEKVESKEGADK